MSLLEDTKRVEFLYEKLSHLRPLSDGEVKRLLEQFAINNTYNSNAIEGNTLTLRETALLLKENITISERPLKDHLDAIGHKEAFDFVVELSAYNSPLKLYDIKQIHTLVLMNDRRNAGVFRSVPVEIVGASHKPPQPYEIEPLMERLIDDYNASGEKDFFERVALLHLNFERIHPFIDGNGRTGRLVLNLELLRHGYHPVDIKFTDRRKYYDAFEQYHLTGTPEIMQQMIVGYECSALEEYVSMVENAADIKRNNSDEDDNDLEQ